MTPMTAAEPPHFLSSLKLHFKRGSNHRFDSQCRRLWGMIQIQDRFSARPMELLPENVLHRLLSPNKGSVIVSVVCGVWCLGLRDGV
mmetsp:Transcript_3970/g.9008  ORF Transcript_3970/g.9008 Transcript_3970/m.9008 type:complete len:87 (-) Transcript_3970:303-563(-)